MAGMIEHVWKLANYGGDDDVSIPLYWEPKKSRFLVKAQDLGRAMGLSPRDSRRVVTAIKPDCDATGIQRKCLGKDSKWQYATVLTGEAVARFLVHAKGKGLNRRNFQRVESDLTYGTSDVAYAFGLNTLPRDTWLDIRRVTRSLRVRGSLIPPVGAFHKPPLPLLSIIIGGT